MKLVLAATLAAVCASLAGCGQLFCSNDDQSCIDSWNDNANSAPYVPDAPIVDESYAHFACGDGRFQCVATGGTYNLDIATNDWTVKLAPSGSLAVDSMKAEGNLVHVQLRATGVGTGGLGLHASYGGDPTNPLEQDLAIPDVHVTNVSDVTIAIAEAAYNKYTFESIDRAYPAGGEGYVELFDAHDQPLIDASTRVAAGSDPSLGAGTGSSLVNYGRFTVGTAPGSRHLIVEGDSFGSRAFDIFVAGTVDRMTGELVEPPTQTADGVVCFHTYWQGHEVPREATAFTFTSDNLTVGSHDNLGANCRHIRAVASGSASATATIDGLTARVAFTVP